MRVLAVGNMYPPHHLGGYELVWRSAVEHLRSRGHEVTVLTTDTRVPGAADRAEEPGVARELRWYWKDHAFPRLSSAARLALERHNAAVFDRHVDAVRPDVVTWWAMGGMSLSLLARAGRAGVPAAAFVHDDWLLYGPQVDAWLRPLAGRPALRRLLWRATGLPTWLDLRAVHAWVFVSEFTRRAAETVVGPLPGAQVAHSGISEAFLDERPEEPWRWRLLYVGRIDPRKGIDTAVAALAELPQAATLTVVGEGHQRARGQLAAQAEELGVQQRVCFAGAHDRAGLKGAYATADAVVFPVRWEEPWGLVPLEAMGMGRPVVATGRGGSAEYLRHEVNTLLFDAGDGEALAGAVRRLASDSQLRGRLRREGVRTARHHTERNFNERVAVVVEDLAGVQVRDASP